MHLQKTTPTSIPTISPIFTHPPSADLGLGWTQVGSDIDGEHSGDRFGTSVSLSSDGKTVAIGAPLNDGNGSNEDSGHVRVYSWDGTSWTQVGSDIDGEFLDDRAGTSVSLSSDGKTVAIGAPHNDPNKNGNDSDSGRIRIYSWDGTSWTQVGGDIDGEYSDDWHGWSGWSGTSVSLSSDGKTVAIGAPRNGGHGSDYGSGHVRVYSWDGTSWTQVGSDIDGQYYYSYFGYSVSLSSDGKTVAIGAPRNGGNGSSSDNVRVFSWDGTSWTQVGSDIDGEYSFDRSGTSVSLSSDGKTVAIGAPYNYGNGSTSGHVRVYSWDATSWTQVGSDIDGEYLGDESGTSVSLSSDGKTVAIGAPWNDGNRSGSGHVRVFSWDGTSWTQVGGDIDGEFMSDLSGDAVSLSSDGKTVAIGAPWNNGNGSNYSSGHVRIFTLQK
jgi:hypothetical protein